MNFTKQIFKIITNIAFALIIAGGIFAVNAVDAKAISISPWHEVYLAPGQTYDVSDAKTNTTVYINKAGDYTLKGESTNCRIVIQSGGVNVYLEDGLEIDPGITAYVGSRTAAITVNDMNGTVKLISKPGADIYFGGYLTAPAIRKYGYNSKLVFETVDSSNPGTITAYRSSTSNSAGIGSAYELTGRVSTGNIEINSGNIFATGGYMSAGIGGGGNGNAYYITINGGNVKAEGGNNGTAIGGGYHGNVSHITINGGTINARGYEGAGIGSGENSSSANYITINGGNITARSDEGAAIGGGNRAQVDYLQINGGTIDAYSRFTGIGSASYEHLGNVKDLHIAGGKLKVYGGIVGIGASTNAPGPNKIIISGGEINVTSDGCAIGGGGFSSVTDEVRGTSVSISNGTVKAEGKAYDIGSNGGWLDYFNVYITGGSVDVDEDDIYTKPEDNPTNGKEQQVYKTTIILHGLTGKTQITDIETALAGVPYNDPKDVWTTDKYPSYSEVYYWLPKGADVVSVNAAGNVYHGNIKAGTTGTLYPDTRVLLKSDDESLAQGAAYVYKGSTKLSNMQEPKIREGHELTGYSIYGTDTFIADAEGNLKKNVSLNGEAYTDANGKWVREYETGLKFKAMTEEVQYQIIFDGNIPENTASKPYQSGVEVPATVTSVIAKYTENIDLAAPVYTLKGYTFSGWNTKSDGTGVIYNPDESVSRLTTGESVTLYAQWEPQSYEVYFDANGGSGTMVEQVMVYDKPEALDACTFAPPEGMRFAGWMRTGVLGGTLRADQSMVVNLCNCSDESNIANGYTLAARWISAEVPSVSVTLDGESYDVGKSIMIKKDNPDSTDDSGEYSLLGTDGIYTCDPLVTLSDGTYSIYVGGSDTNINLVIDANDKNANYAVVEYYSVSVESDGRFDNTALQENNKVVLKGSSVNISAKNAEIQDSGYVFDKWVCVGCIGNFVDSTAYDSSAIIKVNETTVLKAVSKPIQYTVKFDGNIPSGSESVLSGTVENQNYTYDTEQNLHANAYSLTGYTFQGWNTKADGTGDAYADKAVVKNLTSVNDSEVILYAQWKANSYDIIFSGLESDSGQMDVLKCSYDQTVVLPESAFTKKGYHFIGWNTEIDGIGTYYYSGDEVKNLTSEPDASVTLYTVWEHDYYVVKFNANGGDGVVPDVHIWFNEEYALDNPGFIREGYTLIGWNTKADGSGTAYDVEETVENLLTKNGEEMILYAQWKADAEEGTAGDNTVSPDRKDEQTSSPHTGDLNSVRNILLLMTISGAVIFIMAWMRRKKI